jgi:hypothetical protein
VELLNPLEDQLPHSLIDPLGISSPLVSRRVFPFRPGARPGTGHAPRAKGALNVFRVLHGAYKAGEVTLDELQPLFFRSTSDLISYREGWKAGKFWSEQAWIAACTSGNTNGLVSEHVLPRSKTLEHALQLPVEEALDFIWEMSFECVVTKSENGRANKAEHDVRDPWLRYRHADIQVLDICDPTGVFFLSNADRQPLVRHGLLVPYGPKHRAFEVQVTWA